MSFLNNAKDKLKDNINKKTEGFTQLDVDIYQTSSEIIIIAPISGVEVKDLDVSIENNNDVVIIQGEKIIPEFIKENINKKILRKECQWGVFYRQIILPQEINVSEVEAKFKKGILILKLPLLKVQTDKKKKILINSD